jgi:transforming growth factor-beta-induced protein
MIDNDNRYYDLLKRHMEKNQMIIEFQNIDIVRAISMSGHTTMLELIKRSGLEDALKSAQEITLFAPTDRAFDKMERSEFEDLINPKNKEKLASLIKYHIISSAMPASAIAGLDDIETMNGKKVAIYKRNGSLLVNDAEIVERDIKAQNGIIHVLDGVLLVD